MKKLQSEAIAREKKTKEEMLIALERTEKDLNQRNSQAEVKFLKEQRALQRRLAETEESFKKTEEKYNLLNRELQTKQRAISELQNELSSSTERLVRIRQDNDRMYKKIQEIEGR